VRRAGPGRGPAFERKPLAVEERDEFARQISLRFGIVGGHGGARGVKGGDQPGVGRCGPGHHDAASAERLRNSAAGFAHLLQGFVSGTAVGLPRLRRRSRPNIVLSPGRLGIFKEALRLEPSYALVNVERGAEAGLANGLFA
jgi:hypothetical protein